MMSRVDGQTTLAAVRAVVLLLGLSAAAAVAGRRIGLPDAVAFVLVGLAAAVVAPALPVAITPELVLAVLLPGLVFEAAYRLHAEDLRPALGPLVFLAVPGVLLSAVIVAAVLAAATGLRWELALVVGTMVSATDPAAVTATFARLGAPRRLGALVDAESLLNDGTGLVAFALAVAAVGGSVGAGDAALRFVVTVGLSVAAGAAIGALAARVIVRLGDALLQVTVSVVAAYGAYLAADAVHLSGVIASVLAGIVLGNYGRRLGLTAEAERALDAVWSFLAFLLGALIFVLVGLATGPSGLLAAAAPIDWGTLAVLLARAAVVYGVIGGASRLRPAAARPLRGWLTVVFWAGLRGAVATAAALALPLDVPERVLLQRITFGIVLATLVFQGATAGPVLRRALGVRGR